MNDLPLGTLGTVIRWAIRPGVRAFYRCWQELQAEHRERERMAAIAKWTRVYERYYGPLPPGGKLSTRGNLVVIGSGEASIYGMAWKEKLPFDLRYVAVPPD